MPRQPSPQVPIVSYPVPVVTDLMVVDEWNTQDGSYTALPYGSRHPNVSKFPGYFLVKQQPSQKDKWVHRIWVADPDAEDTYNLAREEFDGESNSFPTFIRRYEVRRNAYAPLTKGTALTGVVAARVTAEGSGYTSAPTVTPSGGGGSGATFQALIFRGAVVWIVVTAQGTGYTSAPTLTLTGTATATASIQPATAILTKEWVERQEESSADSAYIRVTRVYQTVPGATVRARRMLLTGFIAEKTQQRVVAATLPAGGNLVLSDVVTPESTVTAQRTIETVFTAAGGVPAAMPIYAFDEIDEKENVVRIRYEQEQPAATATVPNLDTGGYTSKVRLPGNGGTTAILTGISVTAPGTGYTSVPTVTIATPTGSSPVTATATATLKAVGAAIAAGGSSYAVGDTVTASGGTSTQAAVFTLSGFALSTLALNAAGSGYAVNDTITLAGGTASTAAVVTVATVKLASVTPAGTGTGYVVGQVITLAGGTFTTAATVTVSSLCVSGMTLNAAGTGYVVGDTVTLVEGTFSTAATATVSTIKLVSLALNAAGTGYAPADVLKLVGGTFNDEGRVTVSTTKVVSATIAVAGSGYTDGAQTFTVNSGTGTQATVQITVTGGVPGGAVTVLTGGSYTTNPDAPSATTGPAGTGLTLNLVMGVNTFTISDAGIYTVGTTTFTSSKDGGNGSGATFQTGVFGIQSFTFPTLASRGTYSDVPLTATSTSSGAGTGATFTSITAGVRAAAVATAGVYTEESTTLTQSSSGGGTGETFTGLFAINTFTITTAGVYTVTSSTFTQASTSGGGSGATFQTATYSPLLTITTAGNYSVLPSNPVSTTTSGGGSGMTLTLTWGVGAVTLTNAGQGYIIANPLVSFSGGGGTGARARANNTASVWSNATAYIIDGAMEDIEGSTNKRVWWLVCPVPPVRREYVKIPFTFPAIYRVLDSIFRGSFRLKPGVNFTFEDHRPAIFSGRLTIQSQVGEWTDLRPAFTVVTPGSQSTHFPNIQNNTLHNGFVVYEQNDDGVMELTEHTAASTPSADDYEKGDVILVAEWQERLYDSGIWQKFSLEIAEGYVVGLSGYRRSLPYFGNSGSIVIP